MYKEVQMKKVLTPLALVMLVALSIGQVHAEEPASNPLEGTRGIISGQFGNHIGGQGDLAVPLHLTNDSVISTNVIYNKYHPYETLEGGLFARKISPDAQQMVGISAYLGRQLSPNNLSTLRVALGLEYGIHVFKLQVNSYSFFGNKTNNLIAQGIQSGNVVGNNIIFDRNYVAEVMSTNGTDFQIEHKPHSKIKYSVGGFTYNNGITGPKGSVEYQITPKTSIGFFAQYDDVRQGLAYLKLSHWFGALSKPYVGGFAGELLAPVNHDETSPARTYYSHTEQETYQHDIYFASGNGKSNATGGLGDPTTMDHIGTLAKPDDIIMLDAMDGSINLGNYTLQNGQIIQTRAQNLVVNGINVLPANTTQTTTVSGTLNIPGAATISGINFQNATTNATSTTNAINITGANTVNINNVNISGYSGTGINQTGNSILNLTNVTSNQNGSGLVATNGTVNILGDSNTFNQNTIGSGILIENDAILNQAQNVQANNNALHGLYFAGTSGSVQLSNITANGNSGNGLYNASNNLTITGTNSFNTNKQNGVSISGTGALSSGENITTSSNTLAGIRLNGAAGASTLSNIISNSNGSHGLWNSTQASTITGTNTFSSNTGNGIFTDTTGSLVQGTNITASNNSLNGIYLNGVNSASTLTNITANTNTNNGLYISSGQATVEGTNYFENNIQSGISADTNGGLVALVNALITGNGSDGITLAGTTTYTSPWTNVTSTSNKGNGYNISNTGVTINGTAITGSNNTLNGLLLSGGTLNSTGGFTASNNTQTNVNVTGGILSITGTNNSADSSVQGGGIYVSGTGQLTNLQNASTSNNKGGDGININSATTNLSFNDLTSSGNSGNGLWLNLGTATDTGSTNNYFNSNGLWGILVGTSTAKTDAHLLALTNARIAVNGQDGILFNSSATSDNIALTNISTINPTSGTAASNVGSGIYITQAGTFTLNGDINLSYNGLTTNGGSGLRINNTNANVTVNGTITGNNNAWYGLRVANANTVNILGSGNSFSNNQQNGVHITGLASTGSATLNNINANYNAFYGFRVDLTSLTSPVTIYNSTAAFNQAFDGVEVSNATVNLNKVTINNNYRDGVRAISSANVTFDNNTGTSSQIHDNNTGGGGYQIEAQSGANVNVYNPSILLGFIANTTSTANLTVYYKGVPYTPTLGFPINCTIQNGGGSC
jgi:hypothetical protein